MSTAIEYPAYFRGIYDDVRARHAGLMAQAQAALQAMPVNDDLRPALAYQTWENPQPSFILFPLMFLATAEASGGVTARHADFLPTIFLFSEMLAVADDTVDRTARRSGRDTFAARFGDASALPLAAALASLVLADASRAGVFDAFAAYLPRFFGLELWERAHAFPPPEMFDAWLAHRYAQGSWSTQIVLDAALALGGHPAWPTSAVDALNRIGQDIDDIVNLVEFRESDGENDDLMCGMVTRPMLQAIAARPLLATQIADLWDRHRPLAHEQLSIAAYQEKRRAVIRETLPAYVAIRRAILDEGVPASMRAANADLETALRESPAALRPLMHGLANAFLGRLHTLREVAL